ncbi:C1 family peptidase [Siccirubricoccus sp. KC 17139]|uniref:C1 family peptidase n=1 Tax=Siccirubricoccus soli TaxID=2899147 RepID=A0ABT1D8F8_9PROT|nr:C1 family peptidase [Siccirubricoccus soli]MCO6418226.1 C1 family peptidase [Siccirubricoccus soli]MCP2684361.1 C1 family peptidase [Siccirubricoccus soli]
MASPARRRRDPEAAEPGPKTTRPVARERRRPGPTGPEAGKAPGRPKLDAMPDRIDIRDWPYQPRLGPLPDQLVNCDLVPMILDQGQDGACTGFALAAVVNYHLAQRLPQGARDPRLPVSPRMLYEMARRYDEWPGEEYEGSSARGAMLGWVRHGVCPEAHWPANRHGPEHLTPKIGEKARGAPGGAFYRVMHREVRDMHAALAEVGILFCTVMVHEGWFAPGPETRTVAYEHGGRRRSRRLPVIQRKDRARSGHAVAIVGYTRDGFIIQNSWGPGWGRDGFALLPYEDYLLHATDVWVAQLGVPLALDLWDAGLGDTTKGLARAAAAIPLSAIRPFVVDVANNGELSRSGDYWTTEADVHRLFHETIPAAAAEWKRRRVMLYLHGGLNDEAAAARRVVAFRDVLLENQVYPLHIMLGIRRGGIDPRHDRGCLHQGR